MASRRIRAPVWPLRPPTRRGQPGKPTPETGRQVQDGSEILLNGCLVGFGVFGVQGLGFRAAL